MKSVVIINGSGKLFPSDLGFQPGEDFLLSAFGYNAIGVVFAILSLFGFLGNGCALFVYLTNKTLQSPTNLFIMALFICDLLLALCSSIACAASFHHGWVFGQTTCIIEGFSVYFLGLTSMYLLAAISLDRYIVIVKPISGYKISKRLAVAGICVCAFFGFFWAALPLVGWNHYTTEGIEISCSVVWHSDDITYISYIISVFIFCLTIPLCLMVFSYLNIYLTIRNIARKCVWSINSRAARKRQRMERKMLKTAIVLVAVYIFSWLPYTVVSFMSAFGTSDVISPLMATLPALVAKCAGLWNPLVYAATNAQFRKSFLRLFKCSDDDDMVEEDYTVDANKVSKKCCLVTETANGDVKFNLTVTNCIGDDVSPGHTSVEELSPYKCLNGKPRTEIMELCQQQPKNAEDIANR